MLKKFFKVGKNSVKLSRSDPDYRRPLPDFKGQRRDPHLPQALPASKQTTEQRYRKSPLNTLHPRDVRVKTWLSFLGYVSWYVAVFAFIAYRLSSDDLDTLEKEARQQIEIREKIKKEFGVGSNR